MAQYVVTVPGAVTVSDADTGGNSTPPTVVGAPPQWSDNSDATYTELEVFEHPDVSYRDGGHGVLEKKAVAFNPATVQVFARVRYQALASDMLRPFASISRTGRPADRLFAAQTTEPALSEVASMSAVTVDLPMTEWYPGAYSDLLAEIQPGHTQELVLNVYPGFLRVIAFRTPRMRIYEASVFIKGAAVAPPGRLFPRDDYLSLGGHHYPPPTSQQRSGRRFGYH